VPAGRDPWSLISCGHLLTGQNSDNEFCCRMATDVKRCGGPASATGAGGGSGKTFNETLRAPRMTP